MAAASEDIGDEEINEAEFELAEDTDLNEEELDLNVSRKMSIRALNVATMHRFSPGSIIDGEKRLSNEVGANSPRGGQDYQVPGGAFPPKPLHKPSLLLRASSLLQANAVRKSSIGRYSRMTGSRVSNLKAQFQNSFVSAGRDSTFDVNVSIEEEEALPGIIGMSVHRCSMIKKYNIETFFSPAKQNHRRAFTAES